MSFREVIDVWPTYAQMARDLGTSISAIKQMRRRNRIAAHYWSAIVAQSAERGRPVSFEDLAHSAQSSRG